MAVALVLFATTRVFATAVSETSMRMWFLDVGQGDATFIESPEGHQILVDAGRDQGVMSKLGVLMWPWDRSIDAIVITHMDADHITGFVEVLERFDVAMVISTGAEADTQIAQELLTAIEQESARMLYVQDGDRFSMGSVDFRVLWPDRLYRNEVPDDRNNASVVLEVEYRETTVLLTGDIEADVEEQLLSEVRDVDVLKAGHHGSKTSSTPAFLERTLPEVAVISSGENNRYGHPHPIVVERLEAVGAEVFRTDLDGDVLLISSGEEPHVQAHPLPY